MSYHRRCCCGYNCFNRATAPFNTCPFHPPASLTGTIASISHCTSDRYWNVGLLGHPPFRLRYMSGSFSMGSQTMPSPAATGSPDGPTCTFGSYGLTHTLVYNIYAASDTGYATLLGYTEADSIYLQCVFGLLGSQPNVTLSASCRIVATSLAGYNFSSIDSLTIFQASWFLSETEVCDTPTLSRSNALSSCAAYDSGAVRQREIGYGGTMDISP